MDITILVENTSVCENVACVHGLSLYIETDKHRILFDAGPDGELLLKNAEALGIDLRIVCPDYSHAAVHCADNSFTRIIADCIV